MKKFKVTVPPTMEQGSHEDIARGETLKEMKFDALWDYNSARAHDCLPALQRMPKGVKYQEIKE